MTIKYFTRNLISLLGIIVFSSCLNTNDSDIEYSSDAQIYGITLSAAYDSTQTLSKAQFSIDQLLSQIYNRDSLDYGFEPKNAYLTLELRYAAAVKIHLQNPDSIYFWNNTDSVDISRLKFIEVFAQDGITTKKYEFKLNIHQQNPHLLVWSKLTDNYVPFPIDAQKTVAFNDKFYTYYKSGQSIKGVVSSDGITNSPIDVSGLPLAVQFSSIVSTLTEIFALDNYYNVYKTTDGVVWIKLPEIYKVKSIYGILPSVATDSILTAINDEETLKFAKTADFTSFHVMGTIPSDFPITQFSATAIKDPTIFWKNYMVLSGGKNADNSLNSKIWIIQEKDNTISISGKTAPMPIQGSTLFPYDQNIYMLTTSASGKNVLYISEKANSIAWNAADSLQALPSSFPYRLNASIIVDAKNYIRIFGGTSERQTELTDVWRGRLNRLAAH
ncbi:DUF6242 domain-containing protein [Anaerorudis cellulosivorans]|uniref:DUF6242 domain-containing protein n=1 Tax=Anaerorudis cellulosivorans TaxID=3397862 RepID=UPI00221F933C|nr:DUF6242 domain-containing protein [Seramator thermalis]MCW1734693.1 DUF6242 domain-containing protein [Seramator thermalis]